MKPSHKMRDQNFRGIGYCIVCLEKFPTQELTMEHIIPQALAGTLRFEKSVCRRCAEFGNKTFEQPNLVTALLVPRLLLELRKTSTSKLPPIGKGDTTMFAGIPKDLVLNADVKHYPKTLLVEVMDRPGILVGVDRPDARIDFQFAQIDLSEYFPNTHQDENITTSQEFMNNALALSLAKSAYFFAVALMGIDAFDGENIRRLLRGEIGGVRNFVGGIYKKEFLTSRYLHNLELRYRPGGYLTVIVHLFSSYRFPPYEIVVGKLMQSRPRVTNGLDFTMRNFSYR